MAITRGSTTRAYNKDENSSNNESNGRFKNSGGGYKVPGVADGVEDKTIMNREGEGPDISLEDHTHIVTTKACAGRSADKFSRSR